MRSDSHHILGDYHVHRLSCKTHEKGAGRLLLPRSRAAWRALCPNGSLLYRASPEDGCPEDDRPLWRAMLLRASLWPWASKSHPWLWSLEKIKERVPSLLSGARNKEAKMCTTAWWLPFTSAVLWARTPPWKFLAGMLSSHTPWRPKSFWYLFTKSCCQHCRSYRWGTSWWTKKKRWLGFN